MLSGLSLLLLTFPEVCKDYYHIPKSSCPIGANFRLLICHVQMPSRQQHMLDLLTRYFPSDSKQVCSISKTVVLIKIRVSLSKVRFGYQPVKSFVTQVSHKTKSDYVSSL